MYRTAFDIREQIPWGALPFAGVPALFVCVGVGMFLVSRGRGPAWLLAIADQLPTQRPMPKWFPVVWTAFAVALLLAASTALALSYSGYRDALASGAYQVAEGYVTDFVPMPYSGHAKESFSVDGVHFTYSDYVVTTAFNQTRSHGGPIRDGLAVRIAYLRSGDTNAILRLEVDKNEPINTPIEEPGDVPLLSRTVFFPLWIALSLFSAWLFLLSKNVSLKRRLYAPFIIGSMALFVAFAAQRGNFPWFFGVGVLAITAANLRTVGFCDCGRIVRGPNLWQRPSKCSKCGATLTASSQPWLGG